jgi:hypothetical protein
MWERLLVLRNNALITPLPGVVVDFIFKLKKPHAGTGTHTGTKVHFQPSSPEKVLNYAIPAKAGTHY